MWFVATFNTFQPDATKLVPIVVRTNLPYALLRSAPREVRVTTYRCRTTINSLPDLVYVRRDHLHVASTSPYLHVHAIALCPQPLPSPATHAPQLRVQTSCLTPHHTTPHRTSPHLTLTPSPLRPLPPPSRHLRFGLDTTRCPLASQGLALHIDLQPRRTTSSLSSLTRQLHTRTEYLPVRTHHRTSAIALTECVCAPPATHPPPASH